MAKSDKGKPVVGSSGLKKMKFRSTANMPTKRFLQDLAWMSEHLGLAATKVLRKWLAAREAMPDWQPPLIRDKETGEPLTYNGRLLYENSPLPPVPRYETGEIQIIERKNKKGVVTSTFEEKVTDKKTADMITAEDGPVMLSPEGDPIDGSTWMYHEMRKLVPEVGSQIIAAYGRRLYKSLQNKVPRDRPGQAIYVWQSILEGGQQLPTVVRPPIPIPHTPAVLSVARETAESTRENPVYEVLLSQDKYAKPIEHYGKSGTLFTFPLWAEPKKSGRQTNFVVVRMETRQLPRGDRKIFERIARREWKMEDSLLVYHEPKNGAKGRKGKKDGYWALHLGYKQPRLDLDLNLNRVANLHWLGGAMDSPFVVFVGDGAGARQNLGKGVGVRTGFDRLNRRREDMRRMYGVGGTARTGHGRQRNERDMKETTRQMNVLVRMMAFDIVSNLFEFIERYDCGTLNYHEPPLPVRDKSWFAENQVSFDWSTLYRDLKKKANHYGVLLLVNGKKPEDGGE